MKKAIFLFLILLISLPATAQRKAKRGKKPVSYNRHYNEILPKSPQYQLTGWHFAPGATYMLARSFALTQDLESSNANLVEGRFSPLGRPGLYAELGRYKMLPYNGFIKYIDYGISYRGQRGRHKSTITETVPESNTIVSQNEVTSTFGYHFAEAYANANHVWRISKYNFIQNSIGLNAGYAILANTAETEVPNVNAAIPGRLQAQLHYKLGFGIKMRGDWLIIPSVETPVLNLWPWDNGRSSVHFIASRYRPVIFSLRFFFSRPSNTMDCTPVKTREGVKMPSDMDKQGQLNQRR